MPFKKYISKPTILLVVGGFFSGQFLRSQEVTVFHESVSIGSLNPFVLFGSRLIIKKYPNDIEITLPAFKKEFNAWRNKVIKKGK